MGIFLEVRLIFTKHSKQMANKANSADAKSRATDQQRYLVVRDELLFQDTSMSTFRFLKGERGEYLVVLQFVLFFGFVLTPGLESLCDRFSAGRAHAPALERPGPVTKIRRHPV
jgi:hypothetical protein